MSAIFIYKREVNMNKRTNTSNLRRYFFIDIEKAKADLLLLAESGAPRPSLHSKDKRERELAIALDLLTKRPDLRDM